MPLTIDRTAGRAQWRDRPLERLKLEAYCWGLTFIPHSNNSHLRKAFTLVLVLVWAIITVGIAYDIARATTTYGVLSAVIWTLVGRMWGIEVDQFAFTMTDNDDQ